jgi:AcrR family transcriptional regulator
MYFIALQTLNVIHLVMGIQERRERERDRRRQQIMVAAKRVFSTKGFGKTTMEDIAKDAELSPGTIYLYFKNKDELYASLSLRVLQYLLIRMEHVSAEKGLNLAQRMQSFKQAMLDVYEFDPLILINMFHLQSGEALKDLSEDVLDQIKVISQSALKAMAKIFQEGIDQGVFAAHPSEVLASIVWSIFSGIVLWEESRHIIEGKASDLKENFDIALALFIRGLTVHPKRLTAKAGAGLENPLRRSAHHITIS